MLHLNRSQAKAWNRAQRSQFAFNAEMQKASEKGDRGFEYVLAKMGINSLTTNQGISPGEAYREMEDQTTIILNPAGEFATYSRLNAVAKSINVGKLDYTYRQGSAQTGGTISLSGQTGIVTDAVEYKNAGTVIPIIDHGVQRDWRQMMTSGADGFDVMTDDTREAELVILRTANKYLWDGDATIKSPDGHTWLGVKADPSVAQETTAIDLSSSANSAQAIVEEVRRLINVLRINNNCSGPLDIAVSRETLSYWESTPYSVDDKGFGSLKTFIESLSGVKSVYEDPALVTGFELFAAYIDMSGMHAVTGQAVSTYMVERLRHNDPFQLVKWMAQGFVAKSTYSGQRCALYSKA